MHSQYHHMHIAQCSSALNLCKAGINSHLFYIFAASYRSSCWCFILYLCLTGCIAVGIFARQPLKHTASLPCLQSCLKHSFIICWKDIPLSIWDSEVTFSLPAPSTTPFSSFPLNQILGFRSEVFFTSDLKLKTSSLHLFLYFGLIIFSWWVFINKKPVTYFPVYPLPKILLKVNVLVLKVISVLFKNVSKTRDVLLALIVSNIFWFSSTYSQNLKSKYLSVLSKEMLSLTAVLHKEI